MANLITVVRLLLLVLAVACIVQDPVGLSGVSMVLIAVVFAGDGLDGYVARWRGSTSKFGAVFDIAADRAVEQVLWVVFAVLDAIPLWVPIVVIVRGNVVDALRSLSYAEGMSAFGERTMMRSALTRWLTGGRFMRAFFGLAKALGFVFLAGQVAYRTPAPAGSWIADLFAQPWLQVAGWLVVWLAVALTIVRAVPVVVDALAFVREREPSPAPRPSAMTRTSDSTRVPGA